MNRKLLLEKEKILKCIKIAENNNNKVMLDFWILKLLKYLNIIEIKEYIKKLPYK